MGNNVSDFQPETPEGASSWAKNVGFLLAAGVGALLASTPIINTIFGVKDYETKITQQEGQINALSNTMSTFSDAVGDLKIRMSELETERVTLLQEVSTLKSKLDEEVRNRVELEVELKSKEGRIVELELLLAKLADGKYDSFDE